jgi:hypothetical protein
VNQPTGPDPEPKDATKASEDQRQLQDQLDGGADDPNGPGMQQTGDDIAGESTR